MSVRSRLARAQRANNFWSTGLKFLILIVNVLALIARIGHAKQRIHSLESMGRYVQIGLFCKIFTIHELLTNINTHKSKVIVMGQRKLIVEQPNNKIGCFFLLLIKKSPDLVIFLRF